MSTNPAFLALLQTGDKAILSTWLFRREERTIVIVRCTRTTIVANERRFRVRDGMHLGWVPGSPSCTLSPYTAAAAAAIHRDAQAIELYKRCRDVQYETLRALSDEDRGTLARLLRPVSEKENV